MMVAVIHAGHTLQSSKRNISGLRFVTAIMFSIYIRVAFLVLPVVCVMPCPYLFNIIYYMLIIVIIIILCNLRGGFVSSAYHSTAVALLNSALTKS
jgi:hypothetical protein